MATLSERIALRGRGAAPRYDYGVNQRTAEVLVAEPEPMTPEGSYTV